MEKDKTDNNLILGKDGIAFSLNTDFLKVGDNYWRKLKQKSANPWNSKTFLESILDLPSFTLTINGTATAIFI